LYGSSSTTEYLEPGGKPFTATAWVLTAKESMPATLLKKPGESPCRLTLTEMLFHICPPGQVTTTVLRS
jgi:hypothetical protein